jgi:hypothetical protein
MPDGHHPGTLQVTAVCQRPVWQSSDEQLLGELGELAPQVEAELPPAGRR